MRTLLATTFTVLSLATAALCVAAEPAPPPQLRAAVVDAAARALAEEYIFPDKAAEMGRVLRSKLEAGDYDACTTLADLLRMLRADLLAVSNDRHIALWEMSEAEKQRQEADDAEEMRSSNHGFRRVEVLPGNVGYLDIRIFDEPRRAATKSEAAMALLADVDALIVDVRFNGGGEGYMVTHLLSYLYADNPVHHLDSRYRDRVDQFWTAAYVPGRSLSGIPLYVLTSNGTFSAAEDFAYGLQTRKRATIVGETTRGGAHPVTFRFFKELGVEMMIPNAESISPITGGNWEGTGGGAGRARARSESVRNRLRGRGQRPAREGEGRREETGTRARAAAGQGRPGTPTSDGRRSGAARRYLRHDPHRPRRRPPVSHP
ncbi:MAG: S41 family peptidase [Thermoanaerobaculaceae bacterium]